MQAVRDMARMVTEAGGEFVRDGKRHSIYRLNGQMVTIPHGSISDRNLRNFEAKVRRIIAERKGRG